MIGNRDTYQKLQQLTFEQHRCFLAWFPDIFTQILPILRPFPRDRHPSSLARTVAMLLPDLSNITLSPFVHEELPDGRFGLHYLFR
jgi:hypothetical protein